MSFLRLWAICSEIVMLADIFFRKQSLWPPLRRHGRWVAFWHMHQKCWNGLQQLVDSVKHGSHENTTDPESCPGMRKKSTCCHGPPSCLRGCVRPCPRSVSSSALLDLVSCSSVGLCCIILDCKFFGGPKTKTVPWLRGPKTKTVPLALCCVS